MAIEIETKLKVFSLDAIRSRLASLGAGWVGRLKQTDGYFDDPGRNLQQGDKCLRLRQQTDGHQERTVLTFKGPKQPADIKQRTEIEIDVNDRHAARQLINALGYDLSITVRKRRELWRYRECLVSLDMVAGLGAFVEIEGPDSGTILAVQQDLGLSDLTHVRDSYAGLLADLHGNLPDPTRTP